MDMIYGILALNAHYFCNSFIYSFFSLLKFFAVGTDARYLNLICKVILNGVRQYEISVGQPLHEC